MTSNLRRPRTLRRKATAPVAAPKERPLVAKDLLGAGHPLHRPFKAWVAKRADAVTSGNVSGGGHRASTSDPAALTVRKARKYLSAFPQYKGIMVPVTTARQEVA
jgi:hypothetical protein